MRGFKPIDVVFCLDVPHVRKIGLRGMLGAGVGGQKGLWCMGLAWREICILARWATTPSKGFYFPFLNWHLCANHPLCIAKICSCAIHFFSPLQVKNKPCGGVQNMR
jgi:hypothetical protein